MPKKLFLHRERAMPTARVPSRSSGRSESVIASTSRNSLVFDTTVQLAFKILDDTSKSFQNLKQTGVVC
jgi:hypothetical protein